jgi:hypothetical protein
MGRENFMYEVRSESPRKLAEKELAEYLGVDPDSIPVMLQPSQWPKSQPKWIDDIMTKRHPAEFDSPIRPRLRRPRKK